MLSAKTRKLIDRLLASREPEKVMIGETLEECAETDAEAIEVARAFAVAAAQVAKELGDADA